MTEGRFLGFSDRSEKDQTRLVFTSRKKATSGNYGYNHNFLRSNVNIMNDNNNGIDDFFLLSARIKVIFVIFNLSDTGSGYWRKRIITLNVRRRE